MEPLRVEEHPIKIFQDEVGCWMYRRLDTGEVFNFPRWWTPEVNAALNAKPVGEILASVASPFLAPGATQSGQRTTGKG